MSELQPLGSGVEILGAEDALRIGAGQDILIVDDDETNLVAFEAALAPLGRRMVLVQTGIEALAKLLEQDYALLLLDVSMPGMTGVETARLVRERPRCKGMPIIFITGMAQSTELILEAYGVGAYDFIIKPIVPDVLRAKVSVYLTLQDRTRMLLRDAAELHEAKALALTTARLEKLQEATAALAEATTPRDVASVVVRLGTEAVAASAASMWVATADGTLALEGSYRPRAQDLDPWRVIPADSSLPVMRVATQRQPIWIQTEADLAREAPDVMESARAAQCANASALLPLLGKDRTLGVISFSYDGEHTFSDEERKFLWALVRACEPALERSQLFVAEAEARRLAEAESKHKDEFLAMLGHELRNPLAAMVTALDVIKLRDGELDRELSIVDRKLADLTHIVGDLLDVARITKGKINLRREAVELATAVDAAIDAARPLIEHRAHHLVVRVPASILVDADRARIEQVLENLITNAAAYTPEKGRIEITATVEQGFTTISVRDNGHGISATLLPNVFDLFVQGERTPDRLEGGLGIGLTLVRTLVDLHGGSVAAHSDGPGTGATFTVQWPSASSRTSTRKITKLVRPERRTRPLRILVVDDNVDAADLLCAAFGAIGHEVAVAHDGERALETAAKLGPDVAVLDIGLPVMDGCELARRLRELPSCANTRLIALTGYSNAEQRERTASAGFEQHIVKPIDVTRLESLFGEVVQPTDNDEPAQ